jgi:hypothetical protein
MEYDVPTVDAEDQADAGIEDAGIGEATEETSRPFLGRWNQLVSSTNWEKGRIVSQWRDALRDSGAPATQYSDEAWSRQVGGITAQHVGRLRRVYHRFGQTYASYANLYWSHFQAAMDWNDAEMWLEGAVGNRWSVSQMRLQRWETMGSIAEQRPRDEEVVVCEQDEDFDSTADDVPRGRTRSDGDDVPPGPRPEGPDFGDESEPVLASGPDPGPQSVDAPDQPETSVAFVRPFAQLRDLPDDLAEAFEAFKLAILRHKLDGWDQIPREAVLATLDALQQLVLAPSEDGPSS